MRFIDLKTQHDLICANLYKRFESVFAHNQYIMGPEVAELEDRLADFIAVRHCITMSSGTDALLAALMALEIGPGDEVITTAFSFAATAEAILLLGAKPVFIDIDPVTYNINPNLISAAITSHTKAILPVSLYGQCYDVEKVREVAAAHHLPVIEDAAQSFGAMRNGRYSGAVSTIGCTSFFPAKPLGCYGDGGACFTDDDILAEKLRQIRDHGQESRYHHVRLGFNARLDTLQAAVLLAKLEIFPGEVERRAMLGARYTEALHTQGACSTQTAQSGLLTPFIAAGNRSVYAQYTIQVDARDRCRAALTAMGIPTAIHYPAALCDQPAFAASSRATEVPVSRRVAQRVLSLPMHPYLSLEEQEQIVTAVVRSCV